MGNVTALATLRNCQRATIFLTLAPAVVALVGVILRFFRGKLDSP